MASLIFSTGYPFPGPLFTSKLFTSLYTQVLHPEHFLRLMTSNPENQYESSFDHILLWE